MRIWGVGITALVLGLGMKLSYSGIQIDFKARKARHFQSIFGIKKGEWTELPSLQRIVTTAENVSFWNTPNGISPTFKTHLTTYTIGLFGEGDQPHYFFQTDNPKQADRLAKTLATGLGLDLPSNP